jgi:hypothetical protein
MGEYALFHGGNLIAWSPPKQAIVPRSSTKYEYEVFANATTEIIWVDALLKQLGIRKDSPPDLWCENMWRHSFLQVMSFMIIQSTLRLIFFYFVHERVAQKLLPVRFVSSKDKMIDIFTSQKQCHFCCSRNANKISTFIS